MTVLFLNEFDEKTPFIKELSENLGLRDIDVIILDVKKHRLIKYSPTSQSYSTEETISNSLIRNMLRFRALNIFFKLVYYNWIYDLPKYDHVSYHYVGSIYLFFHRKFSKKGKIQSSAILWGSDFYRSSFLDTKLKRVLYRKVNFIGIANPVMKEDFVLQNPESSQKVRRVVFGIKKLVNIADIKSTTKLQDLRKKWKVTDGEIVITIGYNGRKQQQHLRILETLSGSLKSYADKAHILIPFGYLGNEIYKEEVAARLNDLKLSYTIIDWYSTDEEVVEYRLISDVAINGQTTDAMSASIQEHFFSGSVLLAGQWLPYEYFEELGLNFKSFTWNNLQDRFKSIVENLEEERAEVVKNKEIIWSHSAWPSTIEGWVSLYSENQEL